MGFLNKLFGRSEQVNKPKDIAPSADPQKDYEIANSYESSNKAKAIEHYTMAAKAGHIQAMYKLGCLLENDFVSELNGIKWLENASDNGLPEATVSLIKHYEKRQNYESAIMWCRKAAVQNNAEGMYYYGYFHRNGLGVTENPQAALNWYSRAANAGSGKAMFESAQMLFEGIGVDRDLEQAYELIKQADSISFPGASELRSSIESELKKTSELAQKYNNLLRLSENGDPASQYELACLYLDNPQMSPDAPEQAVKWMKTAAHNGCIDAQYVLGESALESEPQRTDEAIHWMKLAASNGNNSTSNRAALIVGSLMMKARIDLEQAKEYLLLPWNRVEDTEALLPIAECCLLLHQYDEAFNWATMSAEQNNPEAFYFLGLFHLNSLGDTAKGIDAAIEHFEKASALGHAASSYELALIYRGDYDTEADNELASQYTETAAKQGHPDAQFDIGVYALTLDDPEEIEAGIGLLSIAAEHGHTEANYTLATLYRDGINVKQDYEKALNHFVIAGDNGHNKSRVEFAWMTILGLGTKANPEHGVPLLRVFLDGDECSDETKALAMYYLGLFYSGRYGEEKNSLEAASMFSSSAALGNADAMFEYASLFAKGEGVEVDIDTCFEWMNRAAQAGSSKAYYNLGYFYEEGLGTEVNESQAFECFETAAKAHHPYALFRMFEIYNNGEFNIAKDYVTAVKYLRESADRGCPEACCRVGIINFTGEYGLEEDFAEAKYWFERAAADNHGEAYFWLARMYATGDGVPIDFAKSRSLCYQAIENGYSEARKLIRLLDEHGC